MKQPERPPSGPQEPRLSSILGTDHTAALAFGGPLAGWLLVAVISLIPGARPVLSGGNNGPGLLYIAVFATVVGWGIALWRVYTIRSLFSRGIPTVGQVCGRRAARTWVRVEFRYTFHGRPYEYSADLLSSENALQIKPGDTVALLVDPDRPHLALIRDLYL